MSKLSKYAVNNDRLQRGLQLDKKVKEIESKGQDLADRSVKCEGELNKAQDKDLEVSDNKKSFEDLRKEYDSLQSDIDKNNADLKTAKQEQQQFKRENPGIGQEANSATVEQSYKKETGRELNTNLYQNKQKNQVTQGLDDKSKEQAKKAVAGMQQPGQTVEREVSLNKFPASNESTQKRDQQQQKQQEDIER